MDEFELSTAEKAELDALRKLLADQGLMLTEEKLVALLVRIARRSIEGDIDGTFYRLLAQSMSAEPRQSKGPRLLIIDDEPACRTLLTSVFKRRGFDVRSVASVDDAMAILADCSVDFIVSDFKMPDKDGSMLYEELVEKHPRIIAEDRLLFVTGCAADAEKKLGSRAPIIAKPYSVKEIVEIVLASIDGQ